MIQIIGVIFVVACTAIAIISLIGYAFRTSFDQNKELMDNIKKFDKERK
jgi:hypothetical protein|tara:strand:- start:2809 stop:2955 length:147 start_codon:yes stop_codon:yes gene_type:complete